MATRIYVRSEGTPDITPSSWNFANQINPVSVPGVLIKNSGSAMTSKTEATGTTNPTARAMGRTIIGPLKAQTINGSVKGQMRGSENNAGANATLALAVKIIKPDGTDRAVLLAQTASDSATAGNELATTLTNAMFKDAAESASISLSSQVASDGDYLVIEWGFRSATATSRNITLSYGNDSATDLPEDTSTTAANNPWFEFTTTIAFIRETVGSSAGVGGSSVVGAATGSGVGTSAGVGASSVVGAAIISAVGSSTAEASSNVIGEAFSVGAGSSSGIAESSAIGAATSAMVGNASGLTTVTGSLAADAESAADATGISTLNGVSASIVEGVGSSQGITTASFVLSEIHWANASSAGVSVVDGIAGSEEDGSVGLSVGSSLVSGVGAGIFSSIGTITAIATVSGVGDRSLTPNDPVNMPSENRILVLQNEIRADQRKDETRIVTIPGESRYV